MRTPICLTAMGNTYAQQICVCDNVIYKSNYAYTALKSKVVYLHTAVGMI